MDHEREVMRALNFDMSRYGAPPLPPAEPFDRRNFQEIANNDKVLYWMIEAKEARGRAAAVHIALENLSDEDIKKCWKDTDPQGDPSGMKFAVAFARNVIKKVQEYSNVDR